MNRKKEQKVGNGDIILELYFDKAALYMETKWEIENQCRTLQTRHNLTFLEFEKLELSCGRTKQIENEIRNLLPQERGTIVTTRGFLLPLSNSKNLNLSNTPVLLVKSKGRLAYVFPCLLGERYFSILDGLNRLAFTLPELPKLEGEMEEALIERVLGESSKFEKALLLEGREIETSAGKADLIFLDASGRHVIVEVEREATDSSLGQVLRLCAAYQKKFNLSREKLRAAIACTRVHEFVNDAAKLADVEIWMIPRSR